MGENGWIFIFLIFMGVGNQLNIRTIAISDGFWGAKIGDRIDKCCDFFPLF